MKRNRSRRILVFIVCMVMLVNLAPVTAMAATDKTTIDGVTYQLDDSTMIATVYDTTDALPLAVTIPSTVDYGGKTYNVTSIQAQAFAGCTNMTSISIPYGVTSIPAGTFRNCSGLTSVTIPDSVITIEGAAFVYCTSLTQVTIPASVEELGDNAFYGCTSLTTVIFEGSTLPKIIDHDTNVIAPFENTNVCVNGHKAWQNCKCYYCGAACDHTGKTPIDNKDKTHSYGCSVCDDVEICAGSIYKDHICEVCGAYIKGVPVAMELTYDGQEQALVSVNTISGEILMYSLDEHGNYCEEIPTAINAGEYRVWFNYKGSYMNHINVAVGYVDVTIQKANYDMSNAKWDYVEAFSYDGSPKTVSIIGLPGGVTVKEYTGNVSTAAGKYTAKATFAYDSINYNVPVVEDIQWEIKEVIKDTDNSKTDDTTQNNPEENTTASTTQNTIASTTENATENTTEDDNNYPSPQTGDSANICFAVVLMIFGATGIYLLGKRRDKYMK